jgi:hypothetical protein
MKEQKYEARKQKYETVQKIVKTLIAISVLLLAFSAALVPALGNDDDDEVNFLIPEYGYTVDYYRSYGGPAIQACIVGDPELSRGETVDLQIKIANEGYIDGFKRLNVNQTNVNNSKEELLAVAEMEEEEECTTAKDLQATLVSETEYFDVESTTSVQNVEELETGHTAILKYTLKIAGDATAGNYELLLPVSYEYQANVRTATAAIINLGLTDTEYTREYKTKNVTFRLPISIERKPKFEVTGVSGNLTQGKTGSIEVTYKNIGETVAEDSMARIVVMSPLSTEKSVIRLGNIGAGESGTATFKVSADKDAVVKNYGIDSEIKYIDDDGDTSFSENLKVDVPLAASEEKISIASVAVILIILVVLYQIINMHRKRNQTNENSSGEDNE